MSLVSTLCHTNEPISGSRRTPIHLFIVMLSLWSLSFALNSRLFFHINLIRLLGRLFVPTTVINAPQIILKLSIN